VSALFLLLLRCTAPSFRACLQLMQSRAQWRGLVSVEYLSARPLLPPPRIVQRASAVAALSSRVLLDLIPPASVRSVQSKASATPPHGLAAWGQLVETCMRAAYDERGEREKTKPMERAANPRPPSRVCSQGERQRHRLAERPFLCNVNQTR